MKKKIILSALLGAFALAALTAQSFMPLPIEDIHTSTADVNQYQGVYVFMDSKPATQYEYLGKVHINSTGGLSYNAYPDQRKKLIQKAVKEFPKTEGIIITIADNGSADADAIKFK